MDNTDNPSIHDKLCRIQQLLKVPKKHYNSFSKFHYRTVDDIFEAVKPLTDQCKCVLTLTDEPVLVGERIYIKAVSTLSDGKSAICASAYAREPLTQKGMSESQITASAATFARKNSLNALFLLDDSPDIDSQDNTNNNAITDKPPSNVELSAIVNMIKNNDIEAVKQHWDGIIAAHWQSLEPAATAKLNELINS